MDQFFWALPPNLIKESYTGIPTEINRVQSRNIKTEFDRSGVTEAIYTIIVFSTKSVYFDILPRGYCQ